MNRARIATWLPVLAVVVALVLRLAALGRKSMWLDESESVARLPSALAGVAAIQGDPRPEVIYLKK